MYQRIVCFKFKDNTPQDLIQQHMNMFADLQHSIAQIVSYAGGLVMQTEETPPQYDSAHTVTYHTAEDIDGYFHHEAHQAFIRANQAIWDQVLVLDSEITSGESA